jgi:drug/metabolite transporter (DMT)-like permease
MKKGSLGLLGALLALGIIINVWQGGAANTITWLGYAPLLACAVVYGIAALLRSRRQP